MNYLVKSLAFLPTGRNSKKTTVKWLRINFVVVQSILSIARRFSIVGSTASAVETAHAE